jgi:hypothetical protein
MLREIAAGTLIGLGLFAAFEAGCGSGLPPVVRCKLDAVRVLPDDPMQATVYDAVDVIERLRACHRLEADGGS